MENTSNNLMFFDRKGNPIDLNLFESTDSETPDILIAQPGAGQTIETREEWLSRIRREE